jgi:hypothetical protein
MAVFQGKRPFPWAQGLHPRAHAATKSVLGSWPLVFGQKKIKTQLLRPLSVFLCGLCGKCSPAFAMGGCR